MAAPKTDLGIHLENGWPKHRTQCAACEGRGKMTAENGPPWAPQDWVERCGACEGRGYFEDGSCDCEACCHFAEMEETRLDVTKARTANG